MEDRVGLDQAYSLESGALVKGETLFVAGTKSLRDVYDDLGHRLVSRAGPSATKTQTGCSTLLRKFAV